MVRKYHWKTQAKRKIEKWEKSLQKAGRKNRWNVNKNEYEKKFGKESLDIENKRRKNLEKYWKKKRDAKRYQIEKLKDKLDPSRVKKRKKKKKKEIGCGGVRS